MDRIEDNVKRLLNGDAMKETQEFCDFTLEAQNEATGIHIFVVYLLQLNLSTLDLLRFHLRQWQLWNVAFRYLFGTSLELRLNFCLSLHCHLKKCIFFAVAKGVAPAAPSDYIPKLNKNVCYIVAAVLINESGDVLMMQEAKRSCAGQWYLPAGHIEAGETIQQAVEREVMFCFISTSNYFPYTPLCWNPQ
jgi:hypothetical protein